VNAAGDVSVQTLGGAPAHARVPATGGPTLMDITSPRVLYLKAALFVGAGVIAGATILLEHPSLKVAALLAVTVWCFARAYYFAFYVVQHYVDPAYRFAGLGSFLRYVLRRRRDGSG
jgi:hypothetical protein